MGKSLIESITGEIFDKTLSVLIRKDVPVLNNNAKNVATQITEEIAPVVINASNAEPWYQSRIYLGLIGAGLGAIAQHFGVQVSGSDVQLITNSIPEIIQSVGSLLELLGLLYAAYGRIRGNSLKPLGH